MVALAVSALIYNELLVLNRLCRCLKNPRCDSSVEFILFAMNHYFLNSLAYIKVVRRGLKNEVGKTTELAILLGLLENADDD